MFLNVYFITLSSYTVALQLATSRLCYCIYPSTPVRFAFLSINFYVIILRCENPMIQIIQVAYVKNCCSLFYSCVGQLRTELLEIYLKLFGNKMVGYQKLLVGHKKCLLLGMI